MLISIRDYIAIHYPGVTIVSATLVKPPEATIPLQQSTPLDFYDITFQYKGKNFSKLFHTRLNESLDDQFKEALKRCGIQITSKLTTSNE